MKKICFKAICLEKKEITGPVRFNQLAPNVNFYAFLKVRLSQVRAKSTPLGYSPFAVSRNRQSKYQN